ncbi:maleylpyruvate isomerase N-terminal domain-containing protein [Nakamurella sp. PAMC28650]|uniref:maleylpyruvate isomerase N-terminal domain-containing protein n=1 Tax=Nakamurella sp. PAMC28650 TaxID=2762325 RepID=UPI00164E0E7C|nr:maleylpyruvate isomerase N-terminal domain-containing protein [Nakamurella sp. PAMC28650]QNK80029.1 maleylpyruvate isomerase N-terminal domain-containing protein [Nakamurella sp. PAMC28650]
MTLTFAGTLDHDAVGAAVGRLTDLVGSAEVADAWGRESALPGMTVGGLARHLVSQPQCAVEFLTTPGPPDARVLTLVGHYERVDWWRAPVGAPENTSIRDDFNQMGSAGRNESVGVLAWSREQLGAAIAAAGPTTYVPWQDCALPTDDFLVVRLMEIVVHADDLACSVGLATPAFGPEVLEPVLALLAALSAQRRGQDSVLRTLSRHERSAGSISAF